MLLFFVEARYGFALSVLRLRLYFFLVAPGFAPVCGDSPRSSRAKPGIFLYCRGGPLPALSPALLIAIATHSFGL
jgi:hypothetical protein